MVPIREALTLSAQAFASEAWYVPEIERVFTSEPNRGLPCLRDAWRLRSDAIEDGN